MKKSTTMLDFFERKCSTSNSSEVNVELPTTNVAIPIPENADDFEDLKERRVPFS